MLLKIFVTLLWPHLGILGCRGLIYSNSLRATQELCSKAKGQWRPMHKSEWPRVIKKHQENLVEGCSLFWVHRQPQRELLTSMLPYFLPLKLDLTSNKLNFLQRVISFSKWKAYKWNLFIFSNLIIKAIFSMIVYTVLNKYIIIIFGQCL